MTFNLMVLLLAAWLGQAGLASKGPAAWLLPEVTFRPRERAVSNWRSEAALHLDASPGLATNVLLGRDPASVSRCVRLNNYWCIKRAGWAGEIASDAEGHVAFASAAEGADVAALLLRRYYVDYGRKSALAIVSRWAPASCGPVPSLRGPRAGRGSGGARSAADRLATHGLGRTLRAQFLAHGRRAARGGLRRSVVPDRLIGQGMPAPAIAIGLGETPVNLGDLRLGAGPLAGLGPASGRAAGPDLACAADGPRIAAYAAKAAAGVAAKPTEDLELFDAEGRPTPNLARVMRNMSAVEIGPLGARSGLIAAAVERAAEVAAQRAARARSTQPAGPGPAGGSGPALPQAIH